ncbi:hypothetical protein [Bacillus toyonensis]|nr:hypothetical protein [Bacillus toyonensis]
MNRKIEAMQFEQEYYLLELAYESKLRDLKLDIHLKSITKEVAR